MFETSKNDNFFLITNNDNLNILENRIYGYMYYNGNLLRNCNVNEKDIEMSQSLDIVGAFSLVQNTNQYIRIFSGIYGRQLLYFIKEEYMWAVSNSFLLLLQYAKDNFSLHMNEAYSALLLNSKSICPSTITETLCQEIKILSVDEEIQIDKSSRILLIQKHTNKNTLVSLNTEGGLLLMDRWANKWKNIICILQQNGLPLNVQLSGGFDSRCSYGLIQDSLQSQNINIESSKGMKEDFEIVSMIAPKFNLNLNANEAIFPYVKLSDEIIWETQNLCRFGNNQEYLTNVNKFFLIPKITICGNGAAHSWYTDSTEKYKSRMKLGHSELCGNEKTVLVEKILQKSFDFVDEYYDWSLSHGKNFMNFEFMFGRSRYTDGTSMSFRNCNHELLFSPFLDPIYFKFNPIFKGNSDYNLIPALILTRYCEDLLGFPFSGNHSINEDTIAKAKEINSKFSFRRNEEKVNFKLRDNIVYQSNNKENAHFDRRAFLTNYLSKEIYPPICLKQALKDLDENKRHSEKLAYTLFQILETEKMITKGGNATCAKTI